MRSWNVGWAGLGLMIMGLSAPAAAQEAWIGGAPLQTRVHVGANGETWVGVWVDAPNVVVSPRARAPMAVSLVVDTSGSMSGEKIRHAQMATASLLESLSDGDVVSIYGFSNVVSEIAPPTVITPANRGMLMQRVPLLVAGGGTNMYDGMQVAVSRLASAPATHSVRRIFVISDGHANIGPSDPQTLGDLAARATEWGTQVTAIGVGYDYDPQTLSAMAVRSAGRIHHLGAPHQMAAILETELQRMTRTVALNGTIVIEPAPGVVILSGATTGAVIDGGRLRFPLGAMDAGQRREVLFRVRMPTAHTGLRTLATVRLTYQDPSGESAPRTQTAAVRYEVGGADAAPTPRVAAMVVDYETNESQRQAAAMLARGEAERAATELEAARQRLATAAAATSDADMRARMHSRATAIEHDEAAARSATTPERQRAASYELQAAPMAADGY